MSEEVNVTQVEDRYYLCTLVCRRTVANKVERFFKYVIKYNLEVVDFDIVEYAHPSWLPDTKGTYGGYFRAILKNPNERAIEVIQMNIPMSTFYPTAARKIHSTL